MRERKFGVEIECGLRGGPRRAEEVLERGGMNHWNEGYIHSDGSGVEIPSPILQGRSGLMELKKVYELLQEAGAYVTTSDGMHVHHDAPEFVDNQDNVERIVETWAANVPNINKLVHHSRRNNGACHNGWNEDTIKQLKSDGERVYHWHRGALNISSLTEHGTIEFRQHEGTLDFDIAAAWIRFGQAMMDSVLRRKSFLTTCETPEVLLRRIRASKGASLTLLGKDTEAQFPVPPANRYDEDYDEYYDDDGYCCEACENDSGW